MGLPYADFFDVTLREFDLITSAVRDRERTNIANRRVLQQELATLVCFAFHEPGDIPDFTENGPPAEQSGAVDREEAGKRLWSALVGFHGSQNQ